MYDSVFIWAGYASVGLIFTVGLLISIYWVGRILKELACIVVEPLSKLNKDIMSDVIISTPRGDEYEMKRLFGFSGKNFFFGLQCWKDWELKDD